MKTTRTHAQPSALSAKPNKAQTITLNWARAMEDFHRCYQQVEATISSLQAKRYSFAVEFKNVENAQMTLQALLRLRTFMCGELESLMTDLDETEGKATGLSNPSQLIIHTQFLLGINQRVKNKLRMLALK